MIDGERTYLTGSWVPNEDGVPAERLVAAGIPDMLFEHFGGRLEWHAPWHTGPRALAADARQGRRRGGQRADPRAGHDDLRFLDNGAIGRRVEGVEGPAHAYHLVPGGASKAGGVDFHRSARGYAPEDCIAIGDSIEDLESAVAVGRFFSRRQRARPRRGAARGALRAFRTPP